jgi:hypothetical protein
MVGWEFMFRLIIEGIGKNLKRGNGEKIDSIYAKFGGNLLLLKDLEDMEEFWGLDGPQKTNFIRRYLDLENSSDEVKEGYLLRLAGRIVSNIKSKRGEMLERLSEQYPNDELTLAVDGLIRHFYAHNDFSGLTITQEYQESKLRFLVDSMKSCSIVYKRNSNEVTPRDIYNKLLDLILFAIENTVIRERIDRARFIAEKSARPKIGVLSGDEQKVICMLNFFKNRAARIKYKFFCCEENYLQVPVVNLIKKGIVFHNANKDMLVLSPAYWSDIECNDEIWGMLKDIVEELHSELRNKKWNHMSIREDLHALAPNIEFLQIYLKERLLVLLNKKCKGGLSEDEIKKMINIKDHFLLHIEILLLFDCMSKARENGNQEFFVNTFERCNRLLERHPEISVGLREIWGEFKKECEPYWTQEKAVSE